MKNNDNTAKELRAVNIDISPRRIEFMDADEFEAEIRADEARKWIERDIRRRKREREYKQKMQVYMLGKALMRIIGASGIYLSFWLMKLIPEAGGGILMIFVPLCLVFVICPLSKEEAFKRLKNHDNFKEETHNEHKD